MLEGKEVCPNPALLYKGRSDDFCCGEAYSRPRAEDSCADYFPEVSFFPPARIRRAFFISCGRNPNRYRRKTVKDSVEKQVPPTVKGKNRLRDFFVRRRVPEPGFTELELKRALKKRGCPVCRLTAGCERDYFFGFLHEGYTLLEVIDKLTASLGFCSAHGHYLVHHTNGLHQAAFVHQIVGRRIYEVLRSAGGRPLPPGLADGDPTRLCPACTSRSESAGRAVFFLAKLLKEAHVQRQYGHPGMLCLPHLQQIAPHLADDALATLLDIHAQRLASVLAAAANDGPAPAESREAWRADALHATVGHDDGLGGFLPSAASGTPSVPVESVDGLQKDLERRDACPVCLAVGRVWRTWAVWFESTGGRGDKIEDLLPRCPRHVWALLHTAGSRLTRRVLRNMLQLADMQVNFAAQKLRQGPFACSFGRPGGIMRRLTSFRDSGVRLGRQSLARGPNCPVCRRLDVAGERTLLLLFRMLTLPHHQAQYGAGHGLCLKHFAAAMAMQPGAQLKDFLCHTQAAGLGLLEWELSEYLRKAAWQARPDPPGDEQRAPRQAVVRFSGWMEY